jgi:hypothetical protein
MTNTKTNTRGFGPSFSYTYEPLPSENLNSYKSNPKGCSRPYPLNLLATLLAKMSNNDEPALQPLNLLPLFHALGIQAPPPLDIPPMPDALPALVDEEEEAEEGLFEDWSTIYQDGPDYPPYTDQDIPATLASAVQEGFGFLEAARATELSVAIKNELYFRMKATMMTLMNGLIGNLQDIDTCWQEDYNTIHTILYDSVDPDTLVILETHMDHFRNALCAFLEWIRQSMTPHGLPGYAILPEIYAHYVRHVLRPQVSDEEEDEEEIPPLEAIGDEEGMPPHELPHEPVGDAPPQEEHEGPLGAGPGQPPFMMA